MNKFHSLLMLSLAFSISSIFATKEWENKAKEEQERLSKYFKELDALNFIKTGTGIDSNYQSVDFYELEESTELPKNTKQTKTSRNKKKPTKVNNKKKRKAKSFKFASPNSLTTIQKYDLSPNERKAKEKAYREIKLKILLKKKQINQQ